MSFMRTSAERREAWGLSRWRFGGVEDHMHLLLGLKATHCVADLVREIKKATHDWAVTRQSGFAWQRGYAALSVGKAQLPGIARYIASQEEHHRRQSSADELWEILPELGIDYDERYFE